MKHITLIVHTDLRKNLVDLLRDMEHVQGYTFSQVEGHGIEVESDPFLSARDAVVGYTPRVRADILLNDDHVDKVLEKLRHKDSGLRGAGIFWVTPVETEGHL